MSQQVRPAYRKPASCGGPERPIARLARYARNFIKARGRHPHTQAGYTEEALTLTKQTRRRLANGEETIYVCSAAKYGLRRHRLFRVRGSWPLYKCASAYSASADLGTPCSLMLPPNAKSLN